MRFRCPWSHVASISKGVALKVAPGPNAAIVPRTWHGIVPGHAPVLSPSTRALLPAWRSRSPPAPMPWPGPMASNYADGALGMGSLGECNKERYHPQTTSCRKCLKDGQREATAVLFQPCRMHRPRPVKKRQAAGASLIRRVRIGNLGALCHPAPIRQGLGTKSRSRSPSSGTSSTHVLYPLPTRFRCAPQSIVPDCRRCGRGV